MTALEAWLLHRVYTQVRISSQLGVDVGIVRGLEDGWLQLGVDDDSREMILALGCVLAVVEWPAEVQAALDAALAAQAAS